MRDTDVGVYIHYCWDLDAVRREGAQSCFLQQHHSQLFFDPSPKSFSFLTKAIFSDPKRLTFLRSVLERGESRIRSKVGPGMHSGRLLMERGKEWRMRQGSEYCHAPHTLNRVNTHRPAS